MLLRPRQHCLDRANLRSWPVVVPPVSNLLVWTSSLTSSTAYVSTGANNSKGNVYRIGKGVVLPQVVSEM